MGSMAHGDHKEVPLKSTFLLQTVIPRKPQDRRVTSFFKRQYPQTRVISYQGMSSYYHICQVKQINEPKPNTVSLPCPWLHLGVKSLTELQTLQ